VTNNDLALAFGRIAVEAGRAILQIYESAFASRTKADGSPVTEADLAAEEIIQAQLQILLPDVPVISEEAAHQPILSDPEGAFLLVDPLDGTREFVAGRPEFTVNIALMHNRNPVAGVVLAPALGEIYLGGETASYGHIALEDPLDGQSLEVIRTRTTIGSPVLALSRSHLDLETKGFIDRQPSSGRIDIGSSLKFGLIARGLADLYPRFSDTMEWDTAAGHAVLNAAGGSITTPQGKPFLYGKAAQAYRNGPFLARGSA
jgi:3'(2'), 5'-bisphosphate nucleotidase